MALDTTHPELEAEQGYIDRAYGCLDLMREDVERMQYYARDIDEQDAFESWKSARIAALSDTASTLVFGRIDERDGETFYIGRHHVRDASYETLVVDWRARVAKAFYQASLRDPMGLRRRRNFLIDGRELLGIADDDLSRSGSGVRGEEILQAELARRTGGPMRDVVATIQAEQDVIIRAPIEGVVVVQGGPGTGKTVVGLHRAAYLLYEYRERLGRMGVLIVGPNPVFIRYISQVLPSLGESAVTQVPVSGLAPATRMQPETDAAVARLKGDVRMAEVLGRALDARCGRLDANVDLELENIAFFVPRAFVEEQIAILRERGSPHASGRERLRDLMLVEAIHAFEDAVPEDEMSPLGFPQLQSAIRNDKAFKRALDTVWPSVTSERLVADLFASPQRLAAASEDLLTDAERKLLKRKRAEPWTIADGPLLDEAKALIEGPPDRYGHVVADEAQDLSPMQLRMLARRCPVGSMTILGDLGQATGAWAHDDWDEVLEHLPRPDGSRTEELTLGYRVTKSITELSSAILAEDAPRLRAPRSVRAEEGEVRVEPVGDVLAGAVDAARSMLASAKAAALIVPDDLVDEVEAALDAAGVSYADADLDHALTVVPVGSSKGLEFEGVIVVEPARVVEQGGLRLLYVAVTRAMRFLTIVHAAELPSALRVPVARAS